MSYTLRPHRGSDLASTFLSCFFYLFHDLDLI